MQVGVESVDWCLVGHGGLSAICSRVTQLMLSRVSWGFMLKSYASVGVRSQFGLRKEHVPFPFGQGLNVQSSEPRRFRIRALCAVSTQPGLFLAPRRDHMLTPLSRALRCDFEMLNTKRLVDPCAKFQFPTLPVGLADDLDKRMLGAVNRDTSPHLHKSINDGSRDAHPRDTWPISTTHI